MPFTFSRAHQTALQSAFLLSPCTFAAPASASLLIDSATVTPPDQCQAELRARVHSPGNELSSAAACSIQNTEFSLGHSRYSHSQSTGQWALDVKRISGDLDIQRWAVGMSAGAVWDSGADERLRWSINIPITFASARGWLLHTNVGWSHSGRFAGGAGLEVPLSRDWRLLAEMYGERRSTGATVQLGLCRRIGDVTAIDLLVGKEGTEDPAWLTVGLNVTFSP